MKKVIIQTKFITLGQMLKFQGIISNGSEVKKFLFTNNVLVNKIAENRRGKKLYNGDIVSLDNDDYLICISNKSR